MPSVSKVSRSWALFFLTVHLVLAGDSKKCYPGPGRKPDNTSSPCLSSGHSACCTQGDICLSGNACYDPMLGSVYQFGCTDSTWQDESCPYKCGWNDPDLLGVMLKYCPGPERNSNAWICQCRNNITCPYDIEAAVLNVTDPSCNAPNTTVGLYAPVNLAPYVSLPTSTLTNGTYRLDSPRYYSPTVVSGSLTWGSTVVDGYTPATVTPFTSYGPQPTAPVILSSLLAQSQYQPASTRVASTAPTTNPAYASQIPPSLPENIGPAKPLSHGLTYVDKAFIGLGVAGTISVVAVFTIPYLWSKCNKRTAHKSDKISEMPWLTPATMLATFITGACLTVGHHLFYQSLRGSPAESDKLEILGASFSRQELNTGIGTALAFLVQSFLAYTVSTAYMQSFWATAKNHQSRSPPMTIYNIDAAFSAHRDFLAYLRFLLWLRKPILLVLASATWLIPIALVFTPGTLSVQSAAVIPIPTRELDVPNLDFRSLSFSANMFVPPLPDATPPGSIFSYNGPSLAVQKIASATAAQGSVLSIPAPYPNATWSLDFLGPSVKCRLVPSDVERSFLENVARSMKSFVDNVNQPCKSCAQPPLYLSWFEPAQRTPINGTSFGTQPNSILNTYSIYPSEYPNATTYIALFPAVMAATSPRGYFTASGSTVEEIIEALNPGGATAPTVIQCDLVESMYLANFEYINGKQNVMVSLSPEPQSDTLPIMDSIFAGGLESVMFAKLPPPGFTPITDLQTGFGQCVTLISGLTWDQSGLKDFVPNCQIDESVLRRLSYQSVLYAFNDLVLGSIQIDLYNPITVNSSILTTSLNFAKELQFLAPEAVNVGSAASGMVDLQLALAQQPQHSAQGLFTASNETTNRPLTELLEELFQNITVSLMSSGALQPNRSSTTNPPLVNVSSPTFHNVYFYAESKLWIAYGIALGISAIALIAGLVSIWINQTTYSDRFSTILRVAGSADLEVEILERDMDGHDPLPKYIGQAEITFPEEHRQRRKIRISSPKMLTAGPMYTNI